MAEIIKARVWTKIDTLENWNANPLILGEGEFAPVLTAPDGSVFNFKVGTGNRRFSDLPWSLQTPGSAQEATPSTVFPAGTPGLYIPTVDGTYNGIAVNLSEGYTQLIWDGSTLVKVVFPIDLSGYATTIEFDPVKEAVENVIEQSKNKADYRNFVGGRWLSTGVFDAQANWLGIHPVRVNDINGQPIVVSGVKGMSTSATRFVFRDVNGAAVEAVNGTGDNAEAFVTQSTIVPVGAYDVVINVGNVVGIGLTPTDNMYSHTTQLELGVGTPSGYEPFGHFIDADKIIGLSDQYDESEVVVIRTNETTTSILYHAGGPNDIWFRVVWFRQTNPSRFIDTWRFNDAHMVRRTGDYSYSNLKQIVNSGVWENAIYTSGAGYTDALGSAHGWEELNNVRFFMDGKSLDFSQAENYRGHFFQAFQDSSFKTADGGGNIGVSRKIWEIKNGVIRIKNMIRWEGALVILANSFLSMLSILREDGEEQITHTAMSNEDLTPYDVSESGFTTPIHTNRNDPLRTSIIIWGDEVKAEMTVAQRKITLADGTLLPFGLPNAGMYVQNNELYNKLYGLFGSTTVEDGDVWEVDTIYKISFSSDAPTS